MLVSPMDRVYPRLSLVKTTDLSVSSPTSHHCQNLGFNHESQQADAAGLDDDLFRDFLELGGLAEHVRTEDDRKLVLNFIRENVEMQKLVEAMKRKRQERAPSKPSKTNHMEKITPPVREAHNSPQEPDVAPAPLHAFIAAHHNFPTPPLTPPDTVPKSVAGGGGGLTLSPPPQPSSPSSTDLPSSSQIIVSAGGDGNDGGGSKPIATYLSLDDVKAFDRKSLRKVSYLTHCDLQHEWL
ncbi:conserved hypothetical protein [Echinococcus multilocularis]|uniref:Uncharacterized protein n=1 Tax=Echinococcus multilocularis TaxID=6211 RepID=A0A068XU54_ECHMU|nr:conserved hypothetical protein [Echinococcus multilocularis]